MDAVASPPTAKEDDRNVIAFRIPNSKSSSPSEHALKSKLKQIISQLVEHIENHPGDIDCAADELQLIMEEGIKDIKTAKLTARTNRRKTAEKVLPKEVPARPEGAASAEARPTSSGPKTWASILRPQESSAHVETPPPSILPLARDDATDAPKTDALLSRDHATDVNASVESAVSDLSSSPKPRDDPIARSHSSPQDRQLSAARSHERMLEAEERRRAKNLEVQQKQEKTSDRVAQAKSRREQMAEKLRQETQEKNERAVKKAEEELEKRKEFASRDSQRVDEVVFAASATQELKAIEIDEKMRAAQSAREELREQKTEALRGRASAHEAVLDRARDLSQHKRETHASKITQKAEQGKRHDELKKLELETKHQAHEEKMSRVQELQAKLQEEERSKARKSEHRIEQSAALRNEQREAQKQKLEQHDKKLREVRERRERGEDGKTFTFHDVMANWVTEVDEAKQSNAVSTIMSAGQRSAKSFCDHYISAHPSPPAARSRFRAMLGRYSSSSCTSQSRQPLHEMLSSLDSSDPNDNWTVGDHMLLRLQNSWATLMKSAIESRHAKPTPDLPTFKLITELIHRLLLHPVEGPAHVEYFARAGHGLAVVAALREEIRLLRKHNTSLPLKAFSSILQIVVSFVNAAVSEKPSIQSARDLLNDALLASDVITFASSVASTSINDVDLASLQYTLILIETLVRTPRRGIWAPIHHTNRTELLTRLYESLVTLVTNVTMPPPSGSGIDPINRNLASSTMLMAFRVINGIARVNLITLQGFLSTPASIAELSHMIGAACNFISANSDHFEKIVSGVTGKELLAAAKGDAATPLTRSFLDAVDFGLTVQELPRQPFSMSMESNAERPTKGCHLRAALHEMILFCGYAALQNKPVQDMFAFLGHGSTTPLLIRVINTLPISYFGLCKHIVAPTLLCICHGHEQNRQIAGNEMDIGNVYRFLKEEADARPKQMKAAKAPTTPPLASAASPPASVAWADMVDDEDEDAFASIGQGAQDAVNNESMCAASVTHSVDTALSGTHHDKRLRHLQVVYFRVDRRFPIHIWQEAIDANPN